MDVFDWSDDRSAYPDMIPGFDSSPWFGTGWTVVGMMDGGVDMCV